MPTKSTLRVDKLLSNLSTKYRSIDYIAMDIFPTVPVKLDSDRYRVYDRNFRLPETHRAPGGAAREHSFNVSNASYELVIHALKDKIPDEHTRNYEVGDLRQDTTEELNDTILRRVEQETRTLMTTTSWSQSLSLAAGAEFTADTTTSNPILVFDTATGVVKLNSGKSANYGVLSRDGFFGAKNHQSLLDRVKHTSMEMTVNIVAALFGLPKLFVPEAALDSSDEGATSSLAYLWADMAFVGWKPDSAGLKKPSAGYMFMEKVAETKRWRDEDINSEWIKVERKFQPRVVSSLSGFLINNVE